MLIPSTSARWKRPRPCRPDAQCHTLFIRGSRNRESDPDRRAKAQSQGISPGYVLSGAGPVASLASQRLEQSICGIGHPVDIGAMEASTPLSARRPMSHIICPEPRKRGSDAAGGDHRRDIADQHQCALKLRDAGDLDREVQASRSLPRHRIDRGHIDGFPGKHLGNIAQ